jgi:hypothetical protein
VGKPPSPSAVPQAELHPGHFVLYCSNQVGQTIQTQLQEEKKHFLLNVFITLKVEGEQTMNQEYYQIGPDEGIYFSVS